MSHVQGSKEAITLTQENLTHLFNRVDASHLEVDPNRTSLTREQEVVLGSEK